MRKPLALLLLLLGAGFSVLAQSAATPESRLLVGITAYKAGEFSSALIDLQAAAQGFLSPEQMQVYVNTGRFERLPSLETALVYLALTQMRLNREDDAREALMRLYAAERIAPTYATLPLGSEAAEIESLAAALTPSTPLPRNVQAAEDDAGRALPAILPKSGQKKTPAEERAGRQAVIDEMVVRERERIQREADARIAASQRQADQRVAAAEAESQRRVAAAEAEAKKNADARIAEIQRQTDERVRRERLTAEQPSTASVPETQGAAPRDHLLALRTAETAANTGKVDEAVRIYSGLASATAVPHEVLGEAAVGLYRTGAFRESAQAFRKFGTFAKGEEDLRYYYAVALYESGSYAEAQKELSCALPFIQETDDVARYRMKIESSVARTARK